MKFKKGLSVRLISIMTVLCLLLMAIPAFADGGNGKKDKENNPLVLESSSLKDGEKGVSITPEIKLTFSKNVVNMKVKDENMNCFSMYDQEGNSVPIDVIMADDQIETEKRNDIILKPKQDLKKATMYTIKISPELQSKSGVQLVEELELEFSTIEEKKVDTWMIIVILALIVGVAFYFKRKR